MSKFTTQEVDALQKGGNQRAREQFLMKWDTHQMRLPNNSNPEKIREFIKSVYVDKKYYRSTEKPPSDTLGEGDYTKASSYHSFSQSPPYDHQYEERHYGKQAGMLRRKPGSEHGLQGKVTSFFYSPDRQGVQNFENKFANDNAGSRKSDRSVSSDPFRSDGQSPDFYARRIGPNSQGESTNAQKMNAASQLVAKGCSTKKTVSSPGDFGATGSNSHLPKPESLIDSVLEAAPASTTDSAKIELFNHMPAQTEDTFSSPFIDLFADINQMPPIIPPVEEKPLVIPVNNEGWAFFDSHDALEPATQSKNVPPSVIIDAPKGTTDLYYFDWFSAQNSDSSGQPSLATDLRPVGLTGVKNSAGIGSAQLWNTLSEPLGNIAQSLPGVPLHNNESQDMLHCPPSNVDPCIGFKAPEGGVPLGLKASLNPFDLEPEANNMFMDMSSLQAALPDPQLPGFSDGLSNTWFQQDSLMSFIPPVTQGSLAYTGGQLPCQYPQNITSQGSIPPLGGNPFV